MILCCGEALIDMLPAQTEDGSLAFAPNVGGSVFNTSVALSRLGVETELFTGISTDMFGDQIKQHLINNGVGIKHVVISDRPSTLAFVQLTNGSASYSFFDENSAGRMIEPSSLPTQLPGVRALFFGGISLAVEPCANSYAEFLKRESSRHFTMLDPNIRPSFIHNENRFRSRLAEIIPHCDAIKVSDEDLHWLKQGETSLEQKAKSLLADGPNTVFLTKGENGATAYLKGGRIVSVPGENVDVVDTVGAGDTFNAGVLKGLNTLGMLYKKSYLDIKKEQTETILKLAVKTSAVTVTRAGANPPWEHEIN